jgi:hypothetical protein
MHPLTIASNRQRGRRWGISSWTQSKRQRGVCPTWMLMPARTLHEACVFVRPPVALPLLLSSCSTVLVDCLKICPPPRPIGSGKKALMHGPLDPGKSCSCSWPARGQGAGTLCSNVSYCTYDSVLRKKPDQNRIDRASVIRQIDTRASNLTDTPGRAPDDRRGLLFVPLALLPARATLALIGGVVWCGKLGMQWRLLWHAMPSAPYLVRGDNLPVNSFLNMIK